MSERSQIIAALVQALDVPVLALSGEGRILGVGPAAAALLGRSAADLAGIDWRDLVDAADRGAFQAALDDLGAGSAAPADPGVAFHIGPEGGQRFHASLSRVPMPGGSPAILVRLETSPALRHGPDPVQGLDARFDFDQGILFQAGKHAGFAQWFLDIDTREMWATEAYFDLLGFEPFEVPICSAWVRERLHPDDFDESVARMNSLVAGASDVFETDYRLRCKDGTYKWFQVSARRYSRAGRGLPPIICGSLTEISRRKRDETRVKEALERADAARREAENNERLLHVATEHAGVAPWFMVPATGEVLRNDQFGTITGRTGSELEKTMAGMLALVHPDDLSRVQAELSAVMRGDKAEAKADHRLCHKDGHWVWCTSVATPVQRGADGRPDVICGVTFDISERKEYEDRLAAALREAQVAREEAQEAADVLRHSTENSNVVPWYRYPDFGQAKVADHLATILGYGPEFDIDRAMLENLVHPDDIPTAAADFKAMERGESKGYKHDLRLRRADGSWCWFTAMAKKVDRSDEGRPLLICGSLTDIDHLKESEAHLARVADRAQRAQDRLSRLADNIPGAVFERHERADGSVHFPYFSARMPDLFGTDAEAVRADWRAVFSHMPPEDQADLAARIAESRVNLTPIEARVRIAHPDKGARWILLSSLPAAQPDGSIIWYASGSDITDQLESERRAAESADQLRLLEERLRLATGAAGIGVWDLDLATGRLDWDETMFRLFGVDPDRFRGGFEDWRACVHPDDLARSEERFAAAVETCGVFDDEFRVVTPTGSERVIKARAQVMCDGAGHPARVIGVNYDVTEQKAAERRAAEAAEEVRKAHERLHRLADNAPSALFEYREDDDNGISMPYFSANLPRILGVSAPEIEADGSAVFANIHPEDLPSVVQRIAVSRRTMSLFSAQYRVVQPGDEERWVMASSLPFRQPDGGTLWYGNLFDVTEHKAAERRAAEAAEEVHRAHVRLNTLADNTPGVLVEYRVAPDGDFTLSYFSAKLPDLLGVTREALEADSRAMADNLPPEDTEMVLANLARAAAKVEAVTFRHRVNHPEKGLRWILSTSTPVREPDGSVLFYGSLVDITDQMEAEHRLAAAAEEVRTAHERLNTLTDNTATALFETLRTPDGTVSVPYFSARLPAICGVSREDIEADGTAIVRHIHFEDAGEIAGKVARIMDTLEPGTFRHRLVHPRAGLRWILGSVAPVARPDGTVVSYSSMLDITDQMDAEERAARAAEELKRAHERLTLVTDVSTAGIYEYRTFPDGTSDFPYSSARFNEIVGYSRPEIDVLKDRILERIDPEDLPDVLATIQTSQRERAPLATRFRLRHPERGTIWLSASANAPREADGVFTWSATLVDITADVERETELRRAHRAADRMRAENERQALHDGLTGLPNRRYYDRTLADRLGQARAGGPRDCALIRLDLDHFKYVNDTLGHEAGDMVLARVAEVLRRSIRSTDFAARIGGDEFSVLLAPGMTEADAADLVERIREHLARPLVHDGRPCRFGASFGIAHTEDLAEMGDDIQMFADAALYRAKAAGRNRLEFFTPQLHRDILNDRCLAVEIHDGLDHDQFVPFFQPQISAEDDSLVGIETLLRWRHPSKGLLAPDDFMHVADQLRLVPEIDRIMMEKSRDALTRWRSHGLVVPKISFNVSSGRMHETDVVTLAREMAAGDTRVTFELLESILVEEESEAFRFHLDMIRDAGIDIEIDDFGSGHASIVGLMEIAPTGLKIDKRIVMPVARDVRARNLVRAIVEIAETLGIGTVAEGVETEEQAAILRAIGCSVLQGFHFARPLSEDDFLAFARDHARRCA